MRVSLLVLAAVLAVGGCKSPRGKGGGTSGSGTGEPGTFKPIVSPGETPPDTSPITGKTDPASVAHPRIVLTPEMLKRLKSAAAERTPAWRRLETECARYTKAGDLSAGYQGFQWTEAIATLSLCWHATGERAHAELAMKYVQALLDDKRTIGDGAGGDQVVRSDSGYAIRSFAVYTALAYDWLHDAPGMTPELRKKMVDRLRVWIRWYRKDGYLNDNPFANYFWGYFAALNLGAIATAGDNPDAGDWLEHARTLWREQVIPGFGTALRGGEWAEGWQYGQLVTTEMALILAAHKHGTGTDLYARLPWIREAVDHQLHQLLPDRQSVYDNATRHKKPPEPNPQALTALIYMLDEAGQREAAARARFIVDELYPRHPKKYVWMQLFAERPGADKVDPRSPQVLSNHLPGPGLTIARSSWNADAVWTSFQAGPKIAVDHQHNDQGHFELWRGSDALLVDGGGPFAFATINHNTLLIDDGERVLNYTPNQGVWARASRTSHFADDGAVLVAVGDLADAWAPKCALAGCSERAVTKAIRSFVYVRPNLLVIDDQVAVDRDDVGVTWAAHVSVRPSLAGSMASAVLGDSRVDVQTLVGGTPKWIKEPTGSSDHVYRKNAPNGDMWRIEVETEAIEKERWLLHWITAGESGARAQSAIAMNGQGLRGAVGVADGRRIAVSFDDDTPGGSLVLPAPPPELIVIAGLDPGVGYRVTLGGDKACKLELATGGDRKANAGGFIRLSAAGCAVK